MKIHKSFSYEVVSYYRNEDDKRGIILETDQKAKTKNLSAKLYVGLQSWNTVAQRFVSSNHRGKDSYAVLTICVFT